jgi:hypothetical protein
MKAYRIMARNTKTGIRVQNQFLDGHVVTDSEEAWRLSVILAEKQQARSRDPWVAEVSEYTVRDKK